ncbi:hypothetical protein N7451_009009 [Penicillium sp. IBT 35674x]|nr:hypothetical protein N7451_009009 [Penicillium sp. IBT 35674x]
MVKPPRGSAPHFMEKILPLYRGPEVTIRINPSGSEFNISKGLLCAASPVFSAMFQGDFLESKEQTAILEEMDGVVSERGLEALAQWVYTRVVKFDIKEPVEHISAAMEFVRLADKYNIVGLEDPMAQYIKAIIIDNPHQVFDHIDANTHNLTEDQIISAAVLHRNHPVRRLLAKASVAGFLQSGNYQFGLLSEQCPSFAIDLLYEVRDALDSLRPRGKPKSMFKDPISGRWIPLNG